MTPNEKKTAIKNLLSTNLPALLTTAGLPDFQEYLDKYPNDPNKRQIGIYYFQDDDDTNSLRSGFVIHLQLPRILDADDYHDVVYPYIRENLTADVVEMTVRESIESDIIISDMSGTSIIGYFVLFSSDLDDCPEYD